MEQAKKNVGKKAADLVQEGMIVGLGTGSTAFWFIENLIARCKKGLQIKAVASSLQSRELAKKGGIPLADIDRLQSIDLTVDGADEIDPQNQMIKGAGGALLREKIVASMSRQCIIIADETKLVSKLGARKLPVEIVPFGHTSTIHKLKAAGFTGLIRTNAGPTPYITDNGNFILDLTLNPETLNPQEAHERIRSIPGVVETGFFLNLDCTVMIGFQDGSVKII